MTDTKTIDDLYADAAKASNATVPAPAPQAAAIAEVTPETPVSTTANAVDPSPRQRRLWSDQQKREHLAAIAKIKADGGPRSGGVKEYCDKHGLGQSLVSLWRRTLAGSNGGAPRVRATVARASKAGRRASKVKRTAAQERLTTARAVVAVLTKALKALK